MTFSMTPSLYVLDRNQSY